MIDVISAAVLKKHEAAKVAGISTSTLERLIAAGNGPRVLRMSPRRVGIRKVDLDAWLASREQLSIAG
jgi:predicted DNA-binding transcriptional regulator AlpA